ncbi:hypothetical protein [Microvirga massiliensis]|uniref:hypothetical protein n=1 Tax=Microvirga massiliensis TaxID=1033741 RepID=UPI00062B9375|nr:hypothetical protein [Microvirga massiliensis]
MQRLAAAALLLLLVASGAWAEQPDNSPLRVRVRAPEIDPGQEARARQERLLRRMQESEYRFRSICLYCGGRDRWAGTAPFDPAAALAPSRPPSAQSDTVSAGDGEISSN